MKLLTRYLVFAFLTISIFSCNKDDEQVNPDQQLEQASLAFDAQNPPVEIPQAMQTSSNENAQQIASNLALVNSISQFTYNFAVPNGATKSNTPVGRKGSIGGRSAATQENVVVWEYSSTVTDPDTQETFTTTVAYQITDDGVDYIFELFIKFNDGEYLPYIYAEESKDDLRNGMMEIYNPFDETAPSVTLIRFDWSENAAGILNFSYQIEGYKVDILVNPDNSGAMSIYESGSLVYEATWNAAGTEGTYTIYGDNGTLTGNWTAEG